VIFFITENEVVTLTNETTLSYENKANESCNKFYVERILSNSTIENSVIETIEFCKNNILLLKIAPYMLVAICRSTLYRSHIKVYRPPSLKRLQQKLSSI